MVDAGLGEKVEALSEACLDARQAYRTPLFGELVLGCLIVSGTTYVRLGKLSNI